MAAYFVFDQTSPSGDLNEFVFMLRDESRIEEARRILGDPASYKVHVQGKVVKRRAPYNPRWSYHLDPDTISFFEMAIEVCDANMVYVEENLDEVGGSTLPNLHWCPWSSHLRRELSSSEVAADGDKTGS
jgi:hypothetical protein